MGDDVLDSSFVERRRNCVARAQGAEATSRSLRAAAQLDAPRAAPISMALAASLQRPVSMNILVTHGSKRGGTAEIASRIGDRLREAGFAVDVIAAHDVREVLSYDAVVIGGALYAFRWHADARSLVLRNAAALRERTVGFFSSGPLDDSASDHEIPPVRGQHCPREPW